jgi:hypothetical protein
MFYDLIREHMYPINLYLKINTLLNQNTIDLIMLIGQ